MPAEALEKKAELAQKLAQHPKEQKRDFIGKLEGFIQQPHFSHYLARLLGLEIP